jgi:hypothetical protein
MENKTLQRPEIVTDEHLEYLDDLRDSGVTNMFGAGVYLQDEFGLSRNDARTVLTYWMESFGKENR